MKAVATLAIGIAQTLAKPETRKRFAALSSELSAATLDALEPAAWAFWYAAMHRASVDATSSEAMLPASLVQCAIALEETMLHVVRYHLKNDERATSEIADIVAGAGYLDLASDLGRLAVLYTEHQDELRADEKCASSPPPHPALPRWSRSSPASSSELAPCSAPTTSSPPMTTSSPHPETFDFP